MLTIAPGWEVDVQRGPDWLLVKVRGDSHTGGSHAVKPHAVGPRIEQDGARRDCPEVAAGIWDLMQRHFTYRLVLELDQVDVLDSHLIGQLLRLYEMIHEHDGVMRLCGLSPRNSKLLQTCCLDDRFLPYPDCKGAVMGHHCSPIPEKPSHVRHERAR